MAFKIYSDQLIARGGYSSVYAGKNTDSGEKAALKVFEKTETGRALFENEVAIQRRLPTHKNLIKYFGKAQFDGKYVIALEWFPHPTLASFIEKTGELPEEEAYFILEQILDTVNCLADHGIAHRDLKPDNILINPSSRQIKIIDFGLASFLNDGTETRSTCFIGTPHYMAPQVLSKRHRYRVLTADSWSTGLIFWELLLGKNPFAVADSREEMIQLLPDLLHFDGLPVYAKTVLESMLSVESPRRATPEAALDLILQRPSLQKIAVTAAVAAAVAAPAMITVPSPMPSPAALKKAETINVAKKAPVKKSSATRLPIQARSGRSMSARQLSTKA